MTDSSRELAAEYARTAEAYEQYWSPVIRPMALPLLPKLPLARAARVLDVGAGSCALWGDLRAAAPSAELLGIDRSHGMLRAGASHVGRLAVMDCQALGLRRGSIDVATMVFVLFHVPDPALALEELLPALRPGGVLGITTWGKDSVTPGAAIWTEELDRAQAEPDPRDPSVMQHARMDTPAKLRDLVEHAGFSDVRTWTGQFSFQWSVERLLAMQTRCGIPHRRLGTLAPEAGAACVDRVRARFGRLTEPELRQDSEVVFGIAARPAL